MMDEIGTRAVQLVKDTIELSSFYDPGKQAEQIVKMLQMHGFISRCTCPHGFGQVRNPNCPAHGFLSGTPDDSRWEDEMAAGFVHGMPDMEEGDR